MSKAISALLLWVMVGLCAAHGGKSPDEAPVGGGSLRLGKFSVSLAVKDIAALRTFYEKLGLKIVGGNQDQR